MPSIAPALPDDRDVYLVLDDFGGRLGRAWRETDEDQTDRATVFMDLINGQYSNPARIVAFNTAQGWSRDVSDEIADEVSSAARWTASTYTAGARGFRRSSWHWPTGAVAATATRSC